MDFILSHTIYRDLQYSKIKCKPLNNKHKLNIEMLYPPYFKVFCEEKYKCIINSKVNVENVETKIVDDKTEFESSGTKVFKIIP